MIIAIVIFGGLAAIYLAYYQYAREVTQIEEIEAQVSKISAAADLVVAKQRQLRGAANSCDSGLLDEPVRLSLHDKALIENLVAPEVLLTTYYSSSSSRAVVATSSARGHALAKQFSEIHRQQKFYGFDRIGKSVSLSKVVSEHYEDQSDLNSTGGYNLLGLDKASATQ